MQHHISNVLSSSAEGNSFCHLLNHEQILNTTGFKVMHNLSEGLVPAYLSCLNGTRRLVYDVAGLVSLSALAPSLTPPLFTHIAKSLLERFEKIRTNGFICLENLLLDADHIMVDSEQSVHLLYLPIDHFDPTTVKLNSPDLGIRQMLINFIDTNPNVRSERIVRFRSVLKNQQDSLDEARSVLVSNISPLSLQGTSSTALQLVSADGQYSLLIDPHGTVIGRDPSRATTLLRDGSVSGAHCRIFREGHWMLEDLGSKNGTRLNGTFLKPHSPASFCSGDEISISTLRFLVKE